MLKLAKDDASLFANFTGSKVICDLPNADLYKFQGTLMMPNGDLVPLTNECLLLKGCQLRNTGWCYGIAVYTGHQTKVMKNSLKGRPKKSKMELATNHYILIIVII